MSTHNICFCDEIRKNIHFVDGTPLLQSYICMNNKDLDLPIYLCTIFIARLFVCVELSRPSQPSGVMSSLINLPNQA